MQVTESLNEGLKRELRIVIPANELEGQLDERLQDLKSKARINGFRPGKVPVTHLRKVYGKQIMGEIIETKVGETVQKAIDDREERSALQPDIKFTEDENEIEKVISGQADLDFSVAYEILPKFTTEDTSKIKLERLIAEVPDEDVDAQVNQIVDGNRPYKAKESKTAKAKKGERMTFSYLGKIDGEPFEGGADENAMLVLGSGQFIPGFEENLIGLKLGEEKTISVTFPEDYGAAHLAGKEAEFDIEVKEIAAPEDVEIDDEFAKNLGLESMDKLRELIRGQIEGQNGQMTRQHVKRQLLDQLDEMHKIEIPEGMVDQEFNAIWNQITHDMSHSGRTFEDEDTTEEKAREEYRTISERRVRLGLVMAEIGDKNEVQVTDEEVQRAIYSETQRYPGQEQQVIEHYTKNPQALAGLRAPIFEEKVVDLLIDQADVTDKTVSLEELRKAAEDAEEH